MAVLTGLPQARYLVVDNFDVKALRNALTLPTGTITVPATSTGSFDPLASATNVLNRPLTVSPAPSSSNPAAGTVAVDAATGVISFTPTDWFVGDVDVTYEACDDQPNQTCAQAVVRFTVPAGQIDITKALDLPAAAPGPFDFSFTAACTLGSNPTVQTFTATLASATGPGSVSLAGIPAGAACSVSETLPADPADHAWATPVVEPETVTVPADAGVSVTVTNALNAAPPSSGPGEITPVPVGGRLALLLLGAGLLGTAALRQRRA
jgi:hypothetical protein